MAAATCRWIAICCLLLGLLPHSACGQAAALVVDPSIVRSVFYLSTPSALFYPMLVLATLAAIIASLIFVGTRG